ncbi:hypothetical protein [Gordonia sp. (in: high G+C Gram-positive bacteria)]|uniref:aa3-type cytochrome oxidase subunit CtaJ n=1 Tax=Gordonia sp. (in: high G+C Gram-positive bacteria) TaxID=84139 RepID=UPI0039E68970
MVEDLIVPIGLPVVILVCASVILCVLALAYQTFYGSTKYKPAQRYSLDEQWDHAPILFSATELPNLALPAHAEKSDTEGGAANGKW